MSSFVNGTFSINATGTKTIVVGIQPIGLRFRVVSHDGVTDTVLHTSESTVDNTSYITLSSQYSDSTSSQQFSQYGTTAKCISQWERISGTLTEVLGCTFNSFTTTGFKINVNTYGTNALDYTIQVEAWTA